jgi:hypothetical protein
MIIKKSMKKTVEMKKERIAIRVTTLPNGYTVDLEKESFMYYSPTALMEVIKELSKEILVWHRK